MTKIIAYEFLSIDGHFKGRDGAEMDFVHAGFSPRIEKDIGSQYESISAFIMGRRTFDSLAGYWPTDSAQHEHLQGQMNRIPKWVVSHDKDVSSWPGSEHLGKDPFATLERRRKEVDGDLMVIGSSTIVQQLMKLDMIDEFRFLVFPTILGEGTSLFDNEAQPRDLVLTHNKQFETGVIALHYTLRRSAP